VLSRTLYYPLLGALAASGVAGIVNQVSWQRGLKIFLGGSEALSAMTVVFVFMLGLAVGAGAFARRAASVRNPLLTLAVVELALGAANTVVAFLLSVDLTESIYGMQRTAVAAGIPLRSLYVAGAVAVLGVPCFLMGITIPLSSEACQRQLGATHASMVNVLLFVNTAGAVVGALASGFYLLPRYGMTTALVMAAAMNAAAGVVLLALSARAPAATSQAVNSAAIRTTLSPTRDDVIGFFMGAFSLGYEMYLFRAMALGHEPLPYTFAAVLCGFLVAWSIGAYLAYARPSQSLSAALIAAAVGVALMPPVMAADRWIFEWPVAAAMEIASLPVIAFGLVYGRLIARNISRWGSDVGRFSAWNTAGACTGIVLGTLVGYEMAPWSLAAIIAAGIGVVLMYESEQVAQLARSLAIVAVAAFAAYGFWRPMTPPGPIVTAVYDRDGVVEIDRDGNLAWDGLWHSSLTRGNRHVGSSNWLLATAPVLVHPGAIDSALVVGVGTGITVGTLAKIGEVRRVDAYDINRGLETIFQNFPDGTLFIGSNPKVRLRWQDGRSGLALNSDRYDLITQQPLYLKQAGSSLLLSQEYFRLVQRRLKPGGVYTIYSNSSGNAAQSHLVRETAASVFAHAVTFDNGYLIVASDSPIVATEEAFRARLAKDDELAQEMAAYEAAAQRAKVEGRAGPKPLFERLDRAASWDGGGYVISDDHPLVEYPNWSSALVSVPTAR